VPRRLGIENLIKTPMVYSVSYFHLGGLGTLFGEAKPTKAPPPWRRDCMKRKYMNSDKAKRKEHELTT